MKNRPYWQLPMRASGSKAAAFKGYQSRFGDGHPNRRQCVAIARHGGQCRCDAMKGATCCRAHGGHKLAYRNMKPGALSARTGLASARKALAKLSTLEPFPEGEEYSLSPVERGKAIEAARNRRLGLTV